VGAFWGGGGGGGVGGGYNTRERESTQNEECGILTALLFLSELALTVLIFLTELFLLY
jgi:hypothetical protein